MAHSPCDRSVRELDALLDPAKEQTAPAHVAAPDELERKLQARAEDVEQDVDIFRRRNAAEQHDVAVVPDLSLQEPRAAFERLAVPVIVGMHVVAPKCLQRRPRHERVGIAQAGIGRDDVDA